MSTEGQVAELTVYCQKHICDRHSLGSAIVGLCWALLGVATITVVCRLYVRCVRKTTPAGLDDVTIVIAMAIALASGVTTVIFSNHGVGTHIWFLTIPEALHATKWTLIGIFESYFALFFIRISIAIFILRMLQNDSQAHRKIKIAVYVCLFLNFTALLMMCLVEGLWCIPLHGLWNKKVRATCHSRAFVLRGFRAFGGISAATDVLYACLPIAILWPARMKWEVKRNLAIMMLFTLVICACAIGKAATVNETSADYTWANGQPAIWTILEVDLGIIVANLPALRHFYIVTRNDISQLRQRNSATTLNGDEQSPDTNDTGTPRGKDSRMWRLQWGHTTEETEARDDTISVTQDITVSTLKMSRLPNDSQIDEEKVWCGPAGYSASTAHAESFPVEHKKSSR